MYRASAMGRKHTKGTSLALPERLQAFRIGANIGDADTGNRIEGQSKRLQATLNAHARTMATGNGLARSCTAREAS